MEENINEKYMRMAIELAKKGAGAVNPNPMVGAVVVKNGEVIGRGYHKFFGGPHAEVYALEEAGEKAEGMEFLIVKDKPYNGPEDTYEGKMIIFKGKFDEKSSAVVLKPLTPKYEVIFNGGAAHIITKKGPKLEESEVAEWKEKAEKADYLNEWKEKMIQK